MREKGRKEGRKNKADKAHHSATPFAANTPPAGCHPLQSMRSSMEQQRRNEQDRLQQVKPPEAASHPPPPPQKCPRCDSSNTKFCYYNNYSLSQPRYFCKSCRRYWTHGGTLRNVPVGGGCRKSKRPKPSAPSSSSGGSTQPLSPAFPTQNMSSGQPMRPLPPIMGNSFYGGGGSFLSSLAAMQSLSTGINQGATLNLGGGFDANMALMQGATLQSLKSQPSPSQFQLQNDHQYLQPQQNLSLTPRPSLTSWTQNFINRGPTTATTSAASSSFWSAAASADVENQAGSSFNPNHWQDSSNHQGFDPSSDQ